MAVLAYIRVSTILQDVANQKLEALEYSRKHSLQIDDYIEAEVSSRKTQKERRIEELLERLSAGDTLIVAELSRLGRSTGEVIDLVNGMVQRGINLVVIKQGLNISQRMDMQSKVVVAMFSLFSELERDLISERTKQALSAKKAQGVRLGKPKGVIQASRLDDKKAAIQELLRHKVSKSAMARMFGVSRTALVSFVQTRKLIG